MQRPEWAELCTELLDEIAKHIASPHDYARLRAVCKSWNIALPKLSRHIKVPWLVLPFEDDETFDTEGPHQLIRLPQLQDTMICGSCFGCLIAVGTFGELFVFNPFTTSYFLLPPLSTFPGVVSYQPDNYGHEYSLEHVDRDRIYMQKNYILKIVLSSSPEEDEEDEEDLMAVAIYGEYSRLAFYRSGDDKWTDLPTMDMPHGFGYHDVIFHNGKIYAIDGDAHFHEFDMTTLACRVNRVKQIHSSLNKECLVPNRDGHGLGWRYCNMHNKYLVWNPYGHLLMAVRHFHFYCKRKVLEDGEEEVGNFYRTSRFDLYKLDESKMEWCREFSLGDYVLVVGYNSSVWRLPFADKHGNCVRNCIYFSDNMLRYHYEEVIRGNDIGVFNLEDGSINQMCPNSDFLCPAPVWV